MTIKEKKLIIKLVKKVLINPIKNVKKKIIIIKRATINGINMFEILYYYMLHEINYLKIKNILIINWKNKKNK